VTAPQPQQEKKVLTIGHVHATVRVPMARHEAAFRRSTRVGEAGRISQCRRSSFEEQRRYQCHTAYALLPWSSPSPRLFTNIAVIAVQLRHLGADPPNQTLAGSPWFIFDPPVCSKGVASSSPANPQPIQIANHVRGGVYQKTISVCSITFCLYISEYPRIMFRSHLLLRHNLKVSGL
jgi:hypothetical protein